MHILNQIFDAFTLRLYEIVEIFDKDKNDAWDLRENEHFVWLSRQKGTRLFSELGAFAIAKYMDSIEQKTLWDHIVEFVTRHKERLRNAFVRQKVLDNSSSLTRLNNRHFLSKKDIVNILCTSYARLNRAFEDIRVSSSPMEENKHYAEIEGIRYYSLAGIVLLSKELGDSLKQKDRQEWCKAVCVTGNKTLNQIISAEMQKENKITAAKNAAKKRDKCCQITSLKPKPHNTVELAAHHIFSRKHYPHLAESLDNLITLTVDVHKEFHAWNGGFDKPCSVDDLIRFVNEMYPDQEDIVLKLNQIKKVFKGEQNIS